MKALCISNTSSLTPGYTFIPFTGRCGRVKGTGLNGSNIIFGQGLENGEFPRKQDVKVAFAGAVHSSVDQHHRSPSRS